MSKVAPAAPTRIAAIAAAMMSALGSISARLATAAITSTPASSSHDTRCPSRPMIGSFTPSTAQAQIHLRL